MERKGHNAGYIATACGATPALLELQDQVCGTRPQHEGVELIAQHCNQAKLSREAILKQSINMTPVHHNINNKLQAAGSLSSSLLRTLCKIPQNLEG